MYLRVPIFLKTYLNNNTRVITYRLKLHIEKPQAVFAYIAGVYHGLAGDSDYYSVSLGTCG